MAPDAAIFNGRAQISVDILVATRPPGHGNGVDNQVNRPRVFRRLPVLRGWSSSGWSVRSER